VITRKLVNKLTLYKTALTTLYQFHSTAYKSSSK